MRRIHAADDSLWHLLVMTGYLKAQLAGLTPDQRRAVYHLTIPNLEVSLFYDDALPAWLQRVSPAGALPDLLTALGRENIISQAGEMGLGVLLKPVTPAMLLEAIGPAPDLNLRDQAVKDTMHPFHQAHAFVFRRLAGFEKHADIPGAYARIDFRTLNPDIYFSTMGAFVAMLME